MQVKSKPEELLKAAASYLKDANILFIGDDIDLSLEVIEIAERLIQTAKSKLKQQQTEAKQ